MVRPKTQLFEQVRDAPLDVLFCEWNGDSVIHADRLALRFRWFSDSQVRQHTRTPFL
jgi:hypothetical protein